MNLNALKEYIAYDPLSGQMMWLRHNGFKARGEIISGSGTHLHLKGTRYEKAKVAWYLQTGSWPSERITHNNGNRQDLRWKNLSNGKPQSVAVQLNVEQRLESIERLLKNIAEALGL